MNVKFDSVHNLLLISYEFSSTSLDTLISTATSKTAVTKSIHMHTTKKNYSNCNPLAHVRLELITQGNCTETSDFQIGSDIINHSI